MSHRVFDPSPIIGAPFRLHGRGPFFDCFGVLLWCFGATGRQLPDPFHDTDVNVEDFRKRSFLELPSSAELEPLDVVLIDTSGETIETTDGRVGRLRNQHIVIVEDDRWGVTAIRNGHVVRQRLDEVVRIPSARILRLRELVTL